MKQNIDLVKFVRLWTVTILIFIAALIIGLETINNYYDYNTKSQKMREDYTKMQEHLIKQEVEQVVDLIKYKTSNFTLLDDKIKRDLLETISRIRFGEEGYVFVNDLDGFALVANGIALSGDKKLWEVFSDNITKTKNLFKMEYDAAQKVGGEYIQYNFIRLTDSKEASRKVSFILGVPQMRWLIGAGVYLDDVESKVLEFRKELNDHFWVKVFYSFLIFIISIVFVILLTNYLFKKLEKDIMQFYNFFNKAAYENKLINLEEIQFAQLKKLAKSANRMSEQKIEIEGKLIGETEQLNVTLHSIGDALITTDENCKVKLMNPIAEKLIGVKLENVKGSKLSSFFNIVNSKTEKRVTNPVEKVLENGEPYSLENDTKLISQDGNEYQISYSASPIRDIDGNVVGAVLVFRDITNQYMLTENLRQSEERYSRLADLTYEGIVIHKDGVVIDMNKALERISGYSAEELIGKNILVDLILEKYHKLAIDNMQNEVTIPYEVEGIRKDGKILRLEIESRNFYSSNETSKLRVTAIRDISEKIQREEALRESEEKYRLLSETSTDLIVVHNMDGKIKYVNQSCLTLLGYSMEEILNMNVENFVGTENLDEVNQRYEKRKDKNFEVLVYEILIKGKNSEFIPFEIKSIPMIKDGVVENILIVGRDISERKKNEQALISAKERAENADNMKSIFLAQMSHEIRTPINALTSMASLLKYDFEGIADNDQMTSFEIIDRAGDRIIRTIDLLLNLSEVQSGTYQLYKEELSLYSDVLVDLVSKNRLKALSKNLKIHLKNFTVDSKIVADAFTINQIFEQLLDNAIKFTDEGEIRVNILRNENENLVVEVIDTGLGISEDYLTKLFTPFSQEQMGYTREFEGNGLGLALTKVYCDINNARIEIESKKNIGSIFRVIFE